VQNKFKKNTFSCADS